MHESGRQLRAKIHIEAAQNGVAAKHQRDLRAEAREGAREFDGDIARADDRQALGKCRQVENLVRRDRMFDARNLRRLFRPAAGGDEYMPGRDRATAGELHFVRPGDGGALLDDLRAGLVEAHAIEARQARDFFFLGVDKSAPVEPRFADMPAEAGGIREIVAEARCIDVKLLRYAAAHDAGAADPRFLRHGDFRAMAGGNARGARATRSRADDEEIDVGFAHENLPKIRAGGRAPSSRRGRGSSCPSTDAA